MKTASAAPGRRPRRGTAASELLAIRLTPAEHAAIRAAAKKKNLSVSSYVRRRLFPQSGEVVLPAEARQPSPERDLRLVLDAARAECALSNMAPLVFVATVVRACKMPVERAHAAIHLGAMQGLLELRPESGMGRLSKEDAAICPKGWEGVVLSVLRVV